ncbi:MAG: hypothetical protein LBI15_04380 [Dysgonamonadaceae bacterium]|jgi:hypothetical protein|nr:hypothetical protein [Dysgonamonadaceae bacterium]
MRKILFLALSAFLFGTVVYAAEMQNNDMANFIPEAQIVSVINQLKESNQPLCETLTLRIERGVRQVADLWRESDGSPEEFANFCKTSFIADPAQLSMLFDTLERNFEILTGYLHRINVLLMRPLHLEGPPITPVDMMFGAYNVSAHQNADMFATKIAFLTALNFPFYSLEEKTRLGETWTRKEWAYARMGDRFTTRIPAALQQESSRAFTASEAYISNYNIYMGRLRNANGEQLFPDGMRLITHWGLRDELRSQYADTEKGLERQRMIYQIMERIIDKSIPQEVINSDKYTWNPISNTVFDEGREIRFSQEPDTRYEMFLGNIRAMMNFDAYSPRYPTQMQRAFSGGMEIPQEDIESLFRNILSSPLTKEVATFISQRLGRPLEPHDIWYTGFRSSGGIPEDDLTAITQRKFPNAQALEDSIPNMLIQLGWEPERARRIASLIVVEGSRGAGHAWGAAMRDEPARLRTRIGADGMDYKGFNIGIHELGHNVEQTITMNDIDFYSLTRVPNTAFTEAIAFLFQRKDLELIGLENINPEEEHYLALSKFWSCFEIMGVSLVDIQVWEWIYENPNATAAQLRDAVMRISKEVWNTYYADIFGVRDQTILSIYSHMIRRPLYLSNYPIGHVIDFQIGQYVEGKNMADEIDRMLKQGSIVPQIWMQGAVGSRISEQPLLEAVEKALRVLR